MSDQRPWIKLWKCAFTDADLERLPALDQWRWFRLLLYVSLNGEQGSARLRQGAGCLLDAFRLRSADACRKVLDRLPGVVVSDDVSPLHGITVTFTKWHKYQVDSSAERVRRHRAKRASSDGESPLHVTPTNRYDVTVQEEKRREEIPLYPPQGDLTGHSHSPNGTRKPTTDPLDLPYDPMAPPVWIRRHSRPSRG